MRRRMAGRLAAARPAGLLAAAIIFVDGCPGPTLGLLLRNSTLLIALGYIWSALRSCLSVYFDLSPRGIMILLFNLT
jgi:hypothetical protein